MLLYPIALLNPFISFNWFLEESVGFSVCNLSSANSDSFAAAKLSLFADDKLHTENPTDSSKNQLKLINGFSKAMGYKSNIEKPVFHTLLMKYQKDNF